tara:strand:- start:2279 stop:3868 length:1590 start_codon:yes stop_codon:yes gene_type:complete
MQLRPYQQTLVNQAVNAPGSCLIQAATGAGKTVIISGIIQALPTKNIIISVHREELVIQTANTLKAFGIDCESITAKNKYSLTRCNVFVAMTQTLYARKIIPPNIDVIIIDEAHEQIHVKTFDFFPQAKRIGFTATPIINERKTYYQCECCHNIYNQKQICCHNDEASKWSRSITLSEFYNEIFIGPSIQELIEQSSLVKDLVFKYNYYSEVKDIEDKNEIAEESIKHDENVLAEYIDKCEGKKTMIFTASTKQNPSLCKAFEGYPIRSYDSVHNNASERKEMVEWFRNTSGAILVSTGTFTTGFDVREVEAIIINRPTQSLSLYLQMIGRGARPTTAIYKDHFIVIDLGGNVDRFMPWSFTRDWSNIFYNGLTKPKKIKPQLIQCDSCGYNWLGSALEPCIECGNLNKAKSKSSAGRELDADNTTRITTAMNEVDMPNGPRILEYCQRAGLGKADYWNIIIDRYVDLWKFHGDINTFANRISNETLEPRIRSYIKQYYRLSNQLEGMNRTNNALCQKVIDKLKKLYGL